jgi:Uma2 family endonuclease
VIDSDAPEKPDERYSDRFYLAAEIVSSSDRIDVESKRAIYKLHAACKCILTVQQDRFELRIDVREGTGWKEQLLTNPDAQLLLADFGLSCKVAAFVAARRYSHRCLETPPTEYNVAAPRMIEGRRMDGLPAFVRR